jgi:hypothetical protein
MLTFTGHTTLFVVYPSKLPHLNQRYEWYYLTHNKRFGKGSSCRITVNREENYSVAPRHHPTIHMKNSKRNVILHQASVQTG